MGRGRGTADGADRRMRAAAARLGPWLAAASLACGPVAPTAATPDDGPPGPSDDAVVARLGCTVVTAGDVRRWQRIVLAAAPVVGAAGGGPTAPRGFDETCADLVNRTVVSRMAVLVGLQAEPSDIDLGLALMAARSGRTVEQLLAAARDRGLAPAALRELGAGDLERFALLVGAMAGEGWPRHEDVVAECRRRFGEGGCTAEQLSRVRDELREALTPQWMSTRGAEWLAESRAALEALEVEQGPQGCVERPLRLFGSRPADGGSVRPAGAPSCEAPELPAVDGPAVSGGP